MIFYYCPDAFSFPSGGTRTLYRHVDILNAHGIEAAVLHHEPGFRLRWFENATRVVALPEATATPDDWVVLTEGQAHVVPQVFPGLRKVIFNQGCFNTFGNYPLGYTGAYHYEDVPAVMVSSEEIERYLKLAFPRSHIHRVVYGIDPALFFYDPSIKKEQIAIMPRKNLEDIKQVLCILRARGMTLPITMIHDVAYEETARLLRESSIFLSFGHPEGFGLPPAEAMACGCTVVGYHGMGGREFFKEPYAFPVTFGDIAEYVRAVERVLDGTLTVDRNGASLWIHQEYSLERESETVLRCWKAILQQT